jgi:hypothetical protein
MVYEIEAHGMGQLPYAISYMGCFRLAYRTMLVCGLPMWLLKLPLAGSAMFLSSVETRFAPYRRE